MTVNSPSAFNETLWHTSFVYNVSLSHTLYHQPNCNTPSKWVNMFFEWPITRQTYSRLKPTSSTLTYTKPHFFTWSTFALLQIHTLHLTHLSSITLHALQLPPFFNGLSKINLAQRNLNLSDLVVFGESVEVVDPEHEGLGHDIRVRNLLGWGRSALVRPKRSIVTTFLELYRYIHSLLWIFWYVWKYLIELHVIRSGNHK